MSPVPRMVTRSKLGRQLRVNAIEAHEEAGHLLRHSHAHPQVLGKAVTRHRAHNNALPQKRIVIRLGRPHFDGQKVSRTRNKRDGPPSHGPFQGLEPFRIQTTTFFHVVMIIEGRQASGEGQAVHVEGLAKAIKKADDLRRRRGVAEAERRKAEVLKTCGSGGMKHTAAAMMNRA